MISPGEVVAELTYFSQVNGGVVRSKGKRTTKYAKYTKKGRSSMILITGASGQLGGYLLRQLQGAGARVTAWSHIRGGELLGFPLQSVDLGQRDAVIAAFRQVQPDAVLHLAACSAVADCYRNPELAQRINADGTALLAELAIAAGARIVYASTDMVFDGTKGHYCEEDSAQSLSVYGRSKKAGEAAVLAAPRGLVARLSLMFGPTLIGRPYFFDQQLRKMQDGQEVTWFEDEWRSPLALEAAAQAVLTLARSDVTGLLHVGGPERMSRLQMGQRLAAVHRLDPALVVPIKQASVPAPEPRPRDLSLDSTKWRGLFPTAWWPTWEEALQRTTSYWSPGRSAAR
jgi:dTDP-4-dehydrorhamnose reductase